MMSHVLGNFRWQCVLTCGLWVLLVGSVAAQDDLTALEEQAFRAAVDRAAPWVVRIETLGGLEQIDGQLLGSGPTSGVIVSPDGYILSSAFAFASKPSSILVTLPSGQRAAATIVARDTARMLVLLKTTSDTVLSVPEFTPRNELAVGQWTIAVGRTGTDPFPNVSIGILSAVNRVWGRAVQTDAKISSSNYGGALVDIRGRVIGVLVPLSPQQEGEFAGTEWYDSGIGFAVPLADLWPHLDKLKQGTDLRPGLLGVTFKGTDIYSLPPTIVNCAPKSPARAAGLLPGDTIVELDGAKIERQSQLRHALGPRVAGETVRLVVTRGEPAQRVEVSLQLAATIEPYVRPDLGCLPVRELTEANAGPGVTLRFVFPASPAERAGLLAGDRILAVGDRETNTITALRDQLITFDPEQTVNLRVARGDQTLTVDATLAAINPVIPASLPTALPPLSTPVPEHPAVGTIDLRIPEVPNKCSVLVPENYDPRRPYGLLVWLHPPGKFVVDEWVNRWKKLAQDQDLIVMAPQPADEQRWDGGEIEFVRKAMEEVLRTYTIDRTRVVVHGFQAGGSMAYYVALTQRDLVRGVAPISAPLPMRLGRPTTDPVQPLMIFSVSSEQSDTATRIAAGERLLVQAAFPVISRVLTGAERDLNEQELDELVRWINTLDRF